MVTSPMTLERLGPSVGAEVGGVDRNGLLEDDDAAAGCLDALEEFGVLVFRGLHLDDRTQVEFCRRLGRPETVATRAIPEIATISLDPARSPIAAYLVGTFDWHIDGTCDDIPAKATLLTAHEVAESGGETEFAGDLRRLRRASIRPSRRGWIGMCGWSTPLEASQRRFNPDPTSEQVADWRTRRPKEHPLVWRHRSGRRSLVLGATADHVVGMAPGAGRELLDDLLDRATAAERVVPGHNFLVGGRHGDLGQLRRSAPRVTPYEPESRREDAPHDPARRRAHRVTGPTPRIAPPAAEDWGEDVMRCPGRRPRVPAGRAHEGGAPRPGPGPPGRDPAPTPYHHHSCTTPG